MDTIDITTLFGFGESSGQVRLLPLVMIFLLLFVLVVGCSRFFQLRTTKTRKILVPVKFKYQNAEHQGFVLSIGSAGCNLLTLAPLSLGDEVMVDLSSVENFPSSGQHVMFTVKSPSVKLRGHESSFTTALSFNLNQNSAEVQNGIQRFLKTNTYSF